MSRVSTDDEGGIINDASVKTATEAKIQTDLVSELTLANPRRNVSSSTRRAPRTLLPQCH